MNDQWMKIETASEQCDNYKPVAIWAGLMVCNAASASSRAGLAASSFSSAFALSTYYLKNTTSQSWLTLNHIALNIHTLNISTLNTHALNVTTSQGWLTLKHHALSIHTLNVRTSTQNCTNEIFSFFTYRNFVNDFLSLVLDLLHLSLDSFSCLSTYSYFCQHLEKLENKDDSHKLQYELPQFNLTAK